MEDLGQGGMVISQVFPGFIPPQSRPFSSVCRSLWQSHLQTSGQEICSFPKFRARTRVAQGPDRAWHRKVLKKKLSEGHASLHIQVPLWDQSLPFSSGSGRLKRISGTKAWRLTSTEHHHMLGSALRALWCQADYLHFTETEVGRS